MTPGEWEALFSDLEHRISPDGVPSVTRLASDNPEDPFRVLLSTIISARTRDDVTYAASLRLFRRAAAPKDVADLSAEEIAGLIYPAGFYKTKAAYIRGAAEIIARDWEGRVPPDRDLLMRLPGVGRKTANLVLNLGFRVPAICVDTHVHRISNRTGWVRTRTPEETEEALEKILPRHLWIPLNALLVSFGQEVCTPLSPRCGSCPLFPDRCLQRGVERRRD